MSNEQVLDAVSLVNIILESEELPVGQAFTAADVDSNRVINISVRHTDRQRVVEREARGKESL